MRLLFALFGLSLAAAAVAADDAVLTVDTVSGGVVVQRDGKQLSLHLGDALQEQDLIQTEAGGHLTLRFARHGFVDIGPSTEAGVERLPFAAYAKDLKSIFSLSRGYLRVVWKHPQISTSWPLFIYMSGHRISLTSGEFFFQHDGNEQLACAAAGQLALQAVGADGVETIRPPACTRLIAGLPPQTAPRDPDDWIAVRRAYDLHADASKLARLETPEPVAAAAPVVSATPAPLAAPAANPVAPVPAPAPAAATASVVGPAPSAVREPTVLDLILGEQKPSRTEVLAHPGPVSAAPIVPSPSPSPKVGLSAPLPSPVAATVSPPPAPASRPAQAPAPTAVARPAAPAKPAPEWSLNIASYADAASAEQQVQRLRDAGYPVVVQPATVNGKSWWRVQVPGYASQQDAKAAANEIQSKLGVRGIWVLRPS